MFLYFMRFMLSLLMIDMLVLYYVAVDLSIVVILCCC